MSRKAPSTFLSIVLMTNEMHNSCNQFLFHSFLSALHVSSESSRSSSAARHNILYCTHSTIGTIMQASLADLKQLGSPARLCRLYQTVQYSVLCRAPDDERLDSFETCRADKKLWNKIDYKNCASRWSLTQCNMMHGTHNVKLLGRATLCWSKKVVPSTWLRKTEHQPYHSTFGSYKTLCLNGELSGMQKWSKEVGGGDWFAGGKSKRITPARLFSLMNVACFLYWFSNPP